ncbi:hypothetical protein [Baekduia sp. Peel2402]|uniref:hypothetical protein n=1 Tax=Baekduia sp. Peel2402 TaxID=3458296 RepID=UPI00403E7DB4
MTSAALLGLENEVRVPVAGLDCGVPGEAHESVPDAVQLFLDHVPKAPPPSPEQIESIADYCRSRRGNPLLISLAAHGLKGFRGLGDLSEIDLERDFLRPVRIEFDGFSPDQQTALARLSLLHSPWSLDDETARVVGVAVDVLDELLAPFVGAAIQRVSSVLDREPRFEMEPFVQTVAREKFNASRAVQGDAIKEVVAFVDRRLEPAPGMQARTFWGIDRHYETIMHAFSLVDRPAALMMAERLLPFWQARGLFVDADEILGQLADRRRRTGARSESERRLNARILAMRGYVRCFMTRGAFEGPSANELLTSALEIGSGDPMAFGLAHLALTVLHQDEQHLEPCVNLGDALPAWVAADLRVQQGWAHYRASRFVEARSAFKEARAIARDVEPRSDGEAMLGLAWTARRQCYIETAEDWSDTARRIGEQLQDVTLILDAINARVEFFVARGRTAQAEEELATADQLLLKGGLERIRGRIEGSRGQVLRGFATTEPGLERPRELARQSLAVAERLNLRQDQMWRYFDLGNIASLSGDTAQARASFERGHALAVDPALGPPDRWQESRFRQRLARLELVDGQEVPAIAELLDVADVQLGLGVLDDLTWTLVDLEVGAVGQGRHHAAEVLRGARVALCGTIKIGMSRTDEDLESLDKYSEQIKAAGGEVEHVLGVEARQAAHAIGEAAAAGAPEDVTGLKRLLTETRRVLLPGV